MEVEVIAERIHLIPPKGILEQLKPAILEKFGNNRSKFINSDFKLPSDKMRFEVEVVVDDSCELCPTAVEMVAELVAKYKNITARIYNTTYVEPPFDITATPTFRINRRVKFTGIPLDPDSISRYFSEFFKEAYIVSHPKLEWLIERLKKFGEAYGYRRNPNDTAYMNIVYKLLKNIDDYGYPFCPCRPLRRVEGATPQQIYEVNKDKVCPCVYAHTDIKKHGHCLCGLFWSKERVDEYIRGRLEKYGWIIKEIESVQKALDELKKRVVSGRGRVLAESIINKLQDIYASLPD